MDRESGADRGATTAGYSAGVAGLLFVMLLLAFCGISVDLDGLNQSLGKELMGPDGGAEVLTPQAYAKLRLQISEHREVRVLRYASILVALACVSIGVGLLLGSTHPSSAEPPSGTSSEHEHGHGTQEKTEMGEPTLGPRVAGLILVVIGALVVLLAPRHTTIPWEGRAQSPDALRTTGDAGAPAVQAQGADAGTPPPAAPPPSGG